MHREKERFCRICGRPITNPKRFYYCSFECEVIVRRERALAFKGYKAKGITSISDQSTHGTGYGFLAQAIVNTAIEDIRACSKKEIIRFENPGYRTRRPEMPKKMFNYFDAKQFLNGQRITGLTTLDGKEIWKMLMDEKGIKDWEI